MTDLERLFERRKHGLPEWVIGKIPHHYKRISVDEKTAVDLAILGQRELGAAFNCRLFFTQAVIAGAILSGKYNTYSICTTSQYGKSWLMGRTGLLMAYKGRKVYIAGAAADTTNIIMNHTIAAISDAAPEIQDALMMPADKVEKLLTSTSKKRLAFANHGADSGFVEPITLGDTYADNLAANKAVGRGGDFIIDEAALVSDASFAEMGRREFASINPDEDYYSIMISNPHKPGYFYDKLTEEPIPEDHFIIWMDALTAVEEERITEKKVLNSEFAKNASTRRRYLLCELDLSDSSMFESMDTYKGRYKGEYTQYFMGIDAAYKGKDNIEVALNAVDEDGKCHIDEIAEMRYSEWIDGVTSQDIVRKIMTIYRQFHVALICVDIGFGVWLVEALAQAGANVRGINFGSGATKERVKAKHYAAVNATNMRAELHLDMQNLIESKMVDIEEDAYKKVKETLPYITADRRSNNKIQICPKSEVKAKLGHSPDEFDSALLAIHAAIIFSAN